MAEINIIKDTITPTLKKLISQLEDPKEFLVELGRAELSEVELRFRNEVDPEGKPWKPSFRAIAENGQTLTKTTNLRESFDFVVQNNSLFLGTPVPYAESHQFGFDVETGSDLPIRRILGVNDNTIKNAEEIFSALFNF